MDPRDGHRECPLCLGRAHLIQDVDDPCDAAVDLPYAERARRAGQGGQSAPPAQGSKRDSGHSHSHAHSHKRRRHRSAERSHGSSHRRTAHSTERVESQQVDQAQVLAAIQALHERMERFEYERPSASATASSQASPSRGSDYPGEDQDVLSIYADGSITGSELQSELASGNTRSVAQEDEVSAQDVSAGNELMSRILSAAKVIGLRPADREPAKADGVWEGVSQSQAPPAIPEAGEYASMLRTSWGNPNSTSLFNAGCRGLVKMTYSPESGLGDMPKVEQDMAALTALGPDRVSDNPRCPKKECDKTDRLVCGTYNAAARAARSGNALAILLAALRKSIGGDQADQDTRNLIDSALSVHSQLTRDVGKAMASAMQTRRQVWLAQMFNLPQNMRKQLQNMPVVPGHVFHPGSQEALDRAERSFQTRQNVRRTFGRQVFGRLGPDVSHQNFWQGSWGRGKHQGGSFQASGAGTQQGSQSRGGSRGGPRGRPRGSGRGRGRQGGSN